SAPAESMRCALTTLDIQPPSTLNARFFRYSFVTISPSTMPPVFLVNVTPPATVAVAPFSIDFHPDDDDDFAGAGVCADTDCERSNAAAANAVVAKRLIKLCSLESQAPALSVMSQTPLVNAM